MTKNLLFIAFTILTLTAFSQTNVVLRLDHKVGSEEFAFDHEYTDPDQGYSFNIQRLEYYISDIRIRHDGNMETVLEDTWLLVNAGVQEDLYLGKLDISEVESITFSIGVDPEHNHLDPTLYPAGHPLAPQNPSMHWGWAAGYRFAALEGKTGFSLIFTYEIHALGDVNYFSQTINTASIHEASQIVIPLEADYLGLYKDIDVSSGLIEHGENGAAVTLLENFSTHVFSQVAFTDIAEQANDLKLSVYPNPSSTGVVHIGYTSSTAETTEFIVQDMTGRIVQSGFIPSGDDGLGLSLPVQGIYTLHIIEAGKPVTSEKVIFTR